MPRFLVMSITKAVPTVAFIGPPNSGKSSLINRICGKNTAIVANEAHTTRDLNVGYEVWEGMYIRFIDTGGLVPDPEDVIQSEVQIRSWSAMAEADILVWVIDRRTDPEAISEKILGRLWKVGKPFIMVQNKVDDPNLAREEWEYARLGAQVVIPTSTLNGYGINTLLDWLVEFLETKGYEKGNYVPPMEPERKQIKGKRPRKIKISKEGKIFDYADLPSEEEMLEQEGLEGETEKEEIPPKLLILGRPNVGKSTLTNALLGENKQIVSDIAGTTLSVSQYDLTYRDKTYTLLDTVGVRKSGKRTFGAETFATFRTIEAAHQANVIILVFDATTGITAQDQLVAGIARDTRASIVVVANKADLLTDDRRQAFIKDFHFKLNFLKVVDFVWFSAQECLKGNKEYPTSIVWKAIRSSLSESNRVIDQEEVRTLFNYLMKQKPPKKLHTKRRPVIYTLEYVSSQPHTFHLVVKDRTTIHWSYARFLENMIKQQFGLKNTPVKIKIVEPS